MEDRTFSDLFSIVAEMDWAMRKTEVVYFWEVSLLNPPVQKLMLLPWLFSWKNPAWRWEVSDQRRRQVEME